MMCAKPNACGTYLHGPGGEFVIVMGYRTILPSELAAAFVRAVRAGADLILGKGSAATDSVRKLYCVFGGAYRVLRALQAAKG